MIESFEVKKNDSGKCYKIFENDEKIVNTLSIVGEMGLTFWINELPYPIMIYDTSGVWEWNINGQMEIKNIIFDPNSFRDDLAIQIIIEYFD